MTSGNHNHASQEIIMKIPTDQEINDLLKPLLNAAKERNPYIKCIVLNIDGDGKPPFINAYGNFPAGSLKGDYGVESILKTPTADEQKKLRAEALRAELAELESKP